MKKKVAKNIAIFTEYVAHLFKIQALIFIWYITLIGFMYFCGICRDTRLGYFCWGINNDWVSLLKDITVGKLSANFQLEMIFLICFIYMIMSVLKYLNAVFLWRGCSGVSLSYDRYCLTNKITSSIATMAFACAVHGQISIDTMIGIVLVAIILECLASIFLEITGTKKAIWRNGTYTLDVSGKSRMSNIEKDIK